MFGGGDIGNAFGMDQGKAMEASFKEFLARPENAALVEAQQRKEAKQAVQLQEKVRALHFREKTFTNDPSGDFGKWAQNPRVIEMLREAKRLMDEGYLVEDEVEQFMIRQLQDPKHEAYEDFKRKTKQLTERRKGNDAYRNGDYAKALHHYERALSVVELVQGLSRADQAEVDVNRLAVYLNLAAVHMAQKEFGAAVTFCDKALELQPGNPKALLRRCRAHTGRHDYAAAEADLAALRAADPYSIEAAEQAVALERARQVDKRKEAAVFGSMFERGSLGAGTA
ncbi:hypothetical protein COHA_000794 [Chlorella ohadii]|uniref:peptidylprolyl isomerase n=1 Tax=Chlorella ohadii TaxID=2649997 RepID=A0AAD5DX72_9CHLO|nr:hypothetical protein COHA_000794 [Chlorella ohadii]